MIRPLCAAALAALIVFAGCAGPAVPQPEAPPPRPERDVPARMPVGTPTDEAATERFLDQEIERRTPQPPVQQPEPMLDTGTHADRYRTQRQAMREGTPTDESATELFLDHEIERRRYVAPAPVPQRIVERIYVTSPDPYREHYRHEQRYYRSRFPWNTAIGAGLGAVIGHQSGRRDRGAAIGAGIGLLFDLARWH